MFCTEATESTSKIEELSSSGLGYRIIGKIPGDGQKFLDRFKSYFGSQISPQSLNESISTDYSQNPQQKVRFFLFVFVFIHIFVFDCFELASEIANGERSRRSAAR